MSKTQTVTFNVTIEVDVEAWDMAYGSGTSVKEIRDHVRDYFENVILAGGAGDGAVVGLKARWSK